MERQDALWKIVVGLAILVLGIGLAGYMFVGTTSRLMQDDYCYDLILGKRGFLEGQIHSYLSETTYSGNRFSVGFTTGLTEIPGRWTVQVLPGFLIALWILGLYILNRHLNRLGYFITTQAESLLAALAIAFFTIVMAPNWEQVFYWRTGMLTYFAPILAMTWLIVMILFYDQQVRWRGMYLAGIFLLAVLTGGFSETATGAELAALGLTIGLAFLAKRRQWLPAQCVALMGVLAALALLAVSPTTHMRMDDLYGQPAPLSVWPFASFNGAVQFYIATLYRPTLLYFSTFIFFVLLATILVARQKLTTLGIKEFLIQFLVWAVVAFIITWAAMAPSYYAESSHPGNRALIVPRFVSILLIANLGLLIGRLVSSLWTKSHNKHTTLISFAIFVILSTGLWIILLQKHFEAPAYPDLRAYASTHIPVIAGLLLVGAIVGAFLTWRFSAQGALTLVLLLYLAQPILMAAKIYDQVPVLQKRAQLWDWRESQIIAQRESGNLDVVVPALDSLAGMLELSDRTGFWINNCAGRYYKLNSISAIEPVLNPSEK